MVRTNFLICIIAYFAVIFTCGKEKTFVSGQIHFMKGAPHVKLNPNALLSGKVLFSREGRPINAFIGIPYAKIPERFAESELIKDPKWNGVKSATTAGPMCVQAPYIRVTSDSTFGQENCLNLNIYVPMNNTGNKKGYPVMVWTHGGGFMFGGGFAYGPQYLLDEDAILVTLNYRLGVFGFLSTEDSVVPGNNGLKDIVQALNWVQENIKKFGGNPNLVTLFGESAGGAAVHYLLLSPTTKGLFHRAISQSGSGHQEWAYQVNPRDSAVELATFMKCPTSAPSPAEISSEEILSCFKAATTDDLNKAQFSFKKSWPMNMKSFVFGPTKESVALEGVASPLTPFLTKSPWEILHDKNIALAEIPWMVGITEDEGTFFAGVICKNQQLLQQLNELWPELAPEAFGFSKWSPKEQHLEIGNKLRKFYFGSETDPITEESKDALINLYSELFASYGVYKAAVETASRGKKNPVYLYQYAWPGPISVMGMMLGLNGGEENRVGHADEIIHQFDMTKMTMAEGEVAESPIKPDSEHEAFSKNFVKLWVSFAIHGEPKHTWGNLANRKWKPISKKEADGTVPLTYYRIEANPAHIVDPYKDRMDFWEQLHRDHFENAFLSKSKNVPSDKTEL